MKKVFINFTSYDGNEWVVIHHVGTDMTESVQEFKKNLKDYLSIGPDDCHSFNLIKVNLKNKDYDRELDERADKSKRGEHKDENHHEHTLWQ